MIVIDHFEYGRLYLEIWRSLNPATTLEMKTVNFYKLRSAIWYTFTSLYVADKNKLLVGAAGCNPSDAYDTLTGINLALKRMGNTGDKNLGLYELECCGFKEARWVGRMWRLILWLSNDESKTAMRESLFSEHHASSHVIPIYEQRFSELLTAYSRSTDEQIARATETKNGNFLFKVLHGTKASTPAA